MGLRGGSRYLYLGIVGREGSMQRHPVARCLLAVAAAAPAAPRCQLMTAHCLQVRHEPHLLRDRPLHLGGAHGAVPRMLAGRIEASGCLRNAARKQQPYVRQKANKARSITTCLRARIRPVGIIRIAGFRLLIYKIPGN